MSGLISHLNADELATCFMGRRRSKRDRTWLADTMERLNASFQSDGDDGFEWIIAHAMCLFRQLRNSSNVVALACLCVSSKLLDDRCPEIGDGAWETQLPGLTVAEMARVGIFLNIIGAVVVSVIVFTVGTVVFDIDPSIVPDWAQSMAEGVEG